MSDITFREKMVALRKCFIEQRKNDNYQYDQDFWYVLDSISDDLVLKWADRASKIKSPVHSAWIVDEWHKLCNILHYMKTYDPYNQSKWTQSQKRFCTMMILNVWDDLEMDFYC